MRTQKQKRKQPAFRENAKSNQRLNLWAIRQEGATLGIVKAIECRGSGRMESSLDHGSMAKLIVNQAMQENGE